MATGRLTIIDRDGKRTRNVCREHRVAFDGKKCPKCAKAKDCTRYGSEMERWYHEYWGPLARKVAR